MKKTCMLLLSIILIVICLYSCKDKSKLILIKKPTSQYSIEYNDSVINISYKEKDQYHSSFSLIRNHDFYFDKEDSSLFLSLRDTTIYTYDHHFHFKFMSRNRKIEDNLYVAENFQLPYDDRDYSELTIKDSIKPLIHYYYDSNYHIVRIHRFDEVDDFILK